MNEAYTISVDNATLNYKKKGGSQSLKITSNAPEWKVVSDADWLQLSQTTGKENATLNVTFLENSSSLSRSGTITISAQNAPEVKILIFQNGLYPCFNNSPIAPDQTGMSSNAVELAKKNEVGLEYR